MSRMEYSNGRDSPIRNATTGENPENCVRKLPPAATSSSTSREYYAHGIAHAADDDHDNNLNATRKIEALGIDGEIEMTVKAARDAGKKCADDECDDFAAGSVDAHRFSRDLVIVRSDEAAAATCWFTIAVMT